MKPDHPKYEPLKRELIQSAMHEINDLVKEYKLYLDEYVQTTRVARVASMVPTEGQWPAIVRQQNALERLLERKIRLLMDLQEHRILYGAPAPGIQPAPTPQRVTPPPSVIQPSPEGRGWPATALSPAVAGRVRGHFIATPTQHKTQKIVGTNSTIYCSQRP